MVRVVLIFAIEYRKFVGKRRDIMFSGFVMTVVLLVVALFFVLLKK